MDALNLWTAVLFLPPLIPSVVIGAATLAALLFAANGSPRARYVAGAGAIALVIEVTLLCVWRGIFMVPSMDYDSGFFSVLQFVSIASTVLAWLIVLMSAAMGRLDE